MNIASDIKEFGELMRVLAKEIGVFDKFNASCCGTSITQCCAIYEIGLSKGLSLNELANLLNLDNSTISRTIDNLVKQGLVKREENNLDRRYLKIKLTEKGTEVNKNIESQVVNYYQRVLQAIPNEKRAQVVESLKLLSNALIANKCCK